MKRLVPSLLVFSKLHPLVRAGLERDLPGGDGPQAPADAAGRTEATRFA